MQPPASLPRTLSEVASSREERIRHLPAAAREPYQRFNTSGDPAALDAVIFAILDDFRPNPDGAPLATLPGDTRLVADLGFDSLTITEIVFFIEDLFGISISNQEIVLVRSLDDLRSFVRRKVPSPAPPR